MIGFLEAFRLVWQTCREEWFIRPPTKYFLAEFVQEMKNYIFIDLKDFGCVILIAILFTIVRLQLKKRFTQPIAKKLNFTIKDGANFQESTFKFIVYLAMYLASSVILFSRYPQLFSNPEAPWTGWYAGMNVSSDIYWIYVTEAGFYIHGIYGTIFLDIWRDDSIMLLLHHVLTISLIVFSLGLRYHKIGLVVLFLHDIADVCLELTKIIKCFQNRDKAGKSVYHLLTGIGFVVFASAWIGCRLFIYPLVVLYSTGHVGRVVLPSAPFYFFFNALLWILFVMNVWWSYFIILLISRILMGKSKGIEDTRELSLTEEQFVASETEQAKNGVGRKGVNGIKEKGVNGVKENGMNGVTTKMSNVANGDLKERANSVEKSSGDDLVDEYVLVKKKNGKIHTTGNGIDEQRPANGVRKRN
eukprot:Seg413.7 transcript_id=Seg413.7/GoldUCD/mRNA.D3Y31 product="Ceramide synthase 1" protein_id=Seg413.7/GoldUCD/D3Y31